MILDGDDLSPVQQQAERLAGRGGAPSRSSWREDPVIMARLVRVERLRNEGQTYFQIGRALNVDHKTVQLDFKRIDALWRQRTGEKLGQLKAHAVRELNGLIHTMLGAYREERAWMLAVLIDTPITYACPGNIVHKDAALDAELNPLPCRAPHTAQAEVFRPGRGGVSFRSAGAGYLATVEKALTDKARVLGLLDLQNQRTATDFDPGAVLAQVLLGEQAEDAMRAEMAEPIEQDVEDLVDDDYLAAEDESLAEPEPEPSYR